MKTAHLIFLFILCVGFQFTHAQHNKKIKELDQYFQQALEDWNIPGMGISIVKDGEVLLSKGYGVKNVETGEKVNSSTLFAIASNTKAFTSAGLAMLVDRGELSWDDKVVDYLPYFEMYDSYVTDEFTVRDLLCHRSGLATFSGDLIWYGSKYNRREIIERAKFLEPQFGFRESYGYQNIMFVAAGAIIEEVTGQSWDKFIQENILDPLNMNSTLSSVSSIQSQTDIALPHNFGLKRTDSPSAQKRNFVIDWVNWDNMAPAGSLLSSPDDISKWMICQLNKGQNENGARLWEESRSQEMWTMHTPKTLSGWKIQNFPTLSLSGYGLGWAMESYRGKKLVMHGGGYDGMISQTGLVPEENFGIVILTNNLNWLPGALFYQAVDIFFGDEDADWSKFYLETKELVDSLDQVSLEKFNSNRVLGTSPSLDLKEYAGTYTCELYGDCLVRVDGDHLAFEFEPTPLFQGTFNHWHYDTFRLNWTTDMMLPSGTGNFIIDANGKVEELRVDVPNPDFDFTELEFIKME